VAASITDRDGGELCADRTDRDPTEMNHAQVPLGEAVPGLVLLRLHPEKRLWKWTRLKAAVERFSLRLFGRYLVIEDARFRTRPLLKSIRG
jgi:hypothetical protein